MAGLDGLRAAAILFVMICHSALLLEPVGIRVREMQLGGPLGVDLFFVLSGFLVGGILIDLGGDLRGGRVLAGFWLSRALRTWPSYYLFLLLNMGLWAFVYARGPFPWPSIGPSLVFGQNLTHAPTWFFVESWSLCVEEWFYLLVPLGLWVAVRLGARFKVALAIVVGVMFAQPILRRMALPVPADWGLDVNMVVLDKFDALACGVVAAWMSRQYPGAWRKWSGFLALAGLGLLFECCVYALRPGFGQQWLARTFFPLIQPLAFALLVPLACRWTEQPLPVLKPVVAAIAQWSYSLYLVNLNVGIVILTRLQSHYGGSVRAALLCVVVYWVVSFAFAAALYRWFEAPLLRTRRRITLCRETEEVRRRRIVTQIPARPVELAA